MLSMRALLSGAMLLGVLSFQAAEAQSAASQNQPSASDVPTLHVTSRLVFLDVTVLDAKGHPVVKGLTQDDFSITQDKKPQKIFSFEAPDAHVAAGDAADDNPAGKAPVTIFVLDQLNSTFEQMAYIRYCVQQYLAKEPKQLKAPAEVMVLGNESLEMAQGYTRDKRELLSAVEHVPAAIPYKLNPSFFTERFLQSINGLRQIALENSGIPGRKNIVWIGHGGPSLYTSFLDGTTADKVTAYVHKTANMLVNARMSLFLIYPGLEVAPYRTFSRSASASEEEIGDDDPFSGDVNFGIFVNETGGRLFYNRNDLDQLIRTSVELGSHYYTLTYQPPEDIANGKFLRVRVTMRNPALQALTKAGYFSPDKGQPTDPRLDALYNIAEAVQTNVPFAGLDIGVENIVRHSDTNSAEFTVNVNMKNADWKPGTDGKSAVDIGFAGASLSSRHLVLASKTEAFSLTNPSQDPDHLKALQAHLTMTLRVPRNTKSVRLVVGSLLGGRIGSVDVDRKMIDTAPDLPTPEPKLLPQPAKRPPQ
ncbi:MULTISPECIES: VWA domain-containing protein [Acidobacteriaceae]|uniref:VWA domain-containing protein n=1 Tax=Acidobacteriaceae TaxID=204434 RepID=UPI00131BECE7|nr:MULTISPECIES: VWA domain-containing protein [Acidobacteriaceae]MDW5265585.1 VWA domain-containing protein [Edaphobacter sp.]